MNRKNNEQHLLNNLVNINIFNILNAYTVTSDKCNAPLINTSIIYQFFTTNVFTSLFSYHKCLNCIVFIKMLSSKNCCQHW